MSPKYWVAMTGTSLLICKIRACWCSSQEGSDDSRKSERFYAFDHPNLDGLLRGCINRDLFGTSVFCSSAEC